MTGTPYLEISQIFYSFECPHCASRLLVVWGLLEDSGSLSKVTEPCPSCNQAVEYTTDEIGNGHLINA